jgi:hypothetical protein
MKQAASKGWLSLLLGRWSVGGGGGLTCNAALREGALLIELRLYSTESVEVVRKAVIGPALYYEYI